MTLQRYKYIRSTYLKSVLTGDSLMNAHYSTVIKYEALVKVLTEKTIAQNDLILKKDNTIEKLNTNFKEAVVECDQLLNKAEKDKVKERRKGKIEGGLVGGLIGFVLGVLAIINFN